MIVGIVLFYFHKNHAGLNIEIFKDKILSLGIWGPVLYVVFFILRPLVLFPYGVYSALAGAIWGIPGLTFVMIGIILSASLEFLWARYAAREMVQKWIGGKFDRWIDAIEKRGFVTVLLIRLIPNLPLDIQNLALGLTKIKFRVYILATIIGILPGAFIIVYSGTLISHVVSS